MPVRLLLTSAFALVFATTTAQANVVVPFLDLGLNTFDVSISDDQTRGFFERLQSDHQIEYIDLIISNHSDSSLGSTEISYLVFDNAKTFELSGSVVGDGSTRVFDGSLKNVDYLSGQVFHSGETLDASSDARWNVFVVPEPSSLALLSLGGLALLRRRSRGV
ncbi:MAG: PEP-CTERM sorting domain-containing protein [Phycisphaeraceae bacterium]|nr:PEP-CTERM sorting domain-containing protein [Phycisphaeraceae bacterium]